MTRSFLAAYAPLLIPQLIAITAFAIVIAITLTPFAGRQAVVVTSR
jgi:hypothetical protein